MELPDSPVALVKRRSAKPTKAVKPNPKPETKHDTNAETGSPEPKAGPTPTESAPAPAPPTKRKRGRPPKPKPPPAPKPQDELSQNLPPWVYKTKPVTVPASGFEIDETDGEAKQNDQYATVRTFEPSTASLQHTDMPLILTRTACNAPVDWPASTDLDCFTCGRGIPGVPWMVPVERRGPHYVMDDVLFCRFECALRDIINSNDFHATTQAAWLVDIAVRFFGMDRHKLHPAPPRRMLGRFSATGVTTEEYHGGMMHPEVRVSTRRPPFVPSTVVFEKAHPNQARWQVRGLRVPTAKEVERIYREERVVGPVPYPGEAAMYERYLADYDIRSKDYVLQSKASGGNGGNDGKATAKTATGVAESKSSSEGPDGPKASGATKAQTTAKASKAKPKPKAKPKDDPDDMPFGESVFHFAKVKSVGKSNAK